MARNRALRILLAMVFILACLLSLAACDQSASNPPSSSESASGIEIAIGSSASTLSDADGVTKSLGFAKTVADDEHFAIKIAGMSIDPRYSENYGFALYLENKTDFEVRFRYEDGSFSVNGNMVEPRFLYDIKPGGTEQSAFLIFLAVDGVGGFDELKDVEGTIEVRDLESYDVVATYPFNISENDAIPVIDVPDDDAAAGALARRDAIGEAFSPMTLVDDDSYTIRVESLGSDSHASDNYGYVLYLENKTNDRVTFQAKSDSFTVDGVHAEPRFFYDVMPGKFKKNAYLVFSAKDGIEGFDSLKNVEGCIEVRDYNVFEVFASYPISIP